ncbi:MAG: LuxR C-terminal-related transcriptional regulator [Sphingomonadaceae bacterium]
MARLTAGQRACLDLVDDHATSKEIARQLGISRHTVDARLRGAIQVLGVTSRREAAIIYRTAMQAQAYQPFAYQSPRVVLADPADDSVKHGYRPDDSLPSPEPDTAPARVVSHAGRAHVPVRPPVPELADGGAWALSPFGAGGFDQPAPAGASRPLTLRLWGGANDLTPTQRIFGILIVMIIAMLAFGVMLSGIEALTLLRS